MLSASKRYVHVFIRVFGAFYWHISTIKTNTIFNRTTTTSPKRYQIDPKEFLLNGTNQTHSTTQVPIHRFATSNNGMTLLDQVAKYSPVVSFHVNEEYFPCSIEYLLVGSVLKSKTDGSFAIQNPTQDDLLNHRTDDFFIQINPSQFTGVKDPQQPMYCAVQNGSAANTIVISYVFLYAYQGGQTIHVDNAVFAGDIDIIIKDYGIHEGDVERATVTLNATDFSLISVGYEAHGDLTEYPPFQVAFENDTHPIVNCALTGHSSHNSSQVGLRVKDDDAKIFDVISVMSNPTDGGLVWRPASFIQLGLDANSQPINDQHWAAFAGKMGQYQLNTLQSATYFDGSGLGTMQWAYVKTLGSALDALSTFWQLDFVQGVAPDGPGLRSWVSNALPFNNTSVVTGIPAAAEQRCS